MPRVNRRTFVLGGLAATSPLALWASRASAAIPYPFKLGVASGDPTPDGVVLWTRLAPSPLNSNGQGGMPNADVRVEWQVAADQNFTTLVASGAVTARYADAHSVHVEVGGLQSGGEYFYRFRADGHISPVGRTRTAPALDATGGQLTMLATSCAAWADGYYTVYRRMAEEQPDLILHLGDYIYEGGTPAGALRSHAPNAEIIKLADYRVRLAQYRTDPDLQAAHAIAPWLVVWDDHELENNYAALARQDGQAPTLTPAQWRQRRVDAYRAYWENMPLRATSKPVDINMQLYRRIRWGRLATFHMLDSRQYRSNQCADSGASPPNSCTASTSRSLLGTGQENWLLDGLGQRLSTWDFIGQQVFFAHRFTTTDKQVSYDAWDGYEATRKRLQTGWVQRGATPVVLTGDVHRSWGNNLLADYNNPSSAIVGTELVSTSVSSGGDGAPGNGTPPLAGLNPHLKFYSTQRGYVRTRTDATRMLVDFRAVDKVTVRGYPIKTLRSYAVQAGRPGLVTP